jgi:hypothetical protein
MLWLKTTSTGTEALVSQYSGSTSTYRFGFRLNSGKLAYWKGGTYIATSSQSVNDGEWHLLAFTKNSTAAIKLYIDGLPDGAGTDTKYFQATPTMMGIFEAGNGDLQAYFDELRFYNRSMSSEEISAIYNNTKNYFSENQTFTKTDSSGDYYYKFTAPSSSAVYEVKVNATYSGEYGEQNVTLIVADIPYINSHYTVPSRIFYNKPSYGTPFYIVSNVTGNTLISVNYTITAPNGTKVMDNINASSRSGDIWNSAIQTIDATASGTTP